MTHEAGSAAPHSLARDRTLIGFWILVSRITGLGKFIVLGAVLGPTFFGNLYQSANLIPTLAFQFLTGGLFAPLLVPPLVRAHAERGRRGAELLAGGFLTVVLLSFGIVAVLLAVAAPLLTWLLGAGIEDPAIAAEQRRAGQVLLVLVVPQLLLYGVAGVGAAAMNARGRFTLAAAAPVLENIGTILTLAVAGVVWGSGKELGEVSAGEVVFLGVGSTAAVGLHALAVWWGARRSGLPLVPRTWRSDHDVRRVLSSARPALGTSTVNATRAFGILVVANFVAGGAVAYNLALAFYFLLSALVARPVSTALLPVLSRLHQAGDVQAVRDRLTAGLTWIVFLGVPAAACLLSLSFPLARAVSFGDLQTDRAVTMIALCLGGLAVGAFAEALVVLHTTASYALGDARSPLVAASVRFGVTSTGAAVAAVATDGPALLLGLAAAVSAGDVVAAGFLGGRVRRRVSGDLGTLRSGTLRAGCAALTTAAAATGTTSLLQRSASGPFVDVLAVAGGVAAAAVVFLCTHLVLRSPEVTRLTRRFGAAS